MTKIFGAIVDPFLANLISQKRYLQEENTLITPTRPLREYFANMDQTNSYRISPIGLWIILEEKLMLLKVKNVIFRAYYVYLDM